MRPLHSETRHTPYANNSATAPLAPTERNQGLLSGRPEERNASVIKHIDEFAGDEPAGITLG